MEVYPFHHKNLFFHIITDCDLSFQEVRGILDYLLEAKAFDVTGGDWGCGKIFDIRLDHILYVVDVNGFEVVLYRREES